MKSKIKDDSRGQTTGKNVNITMYLGDNAEAPLQVITPNLTPEYHPQSERNTSAKVQKNIQPQRSYVKTTELPSFNETEKLQQTDPNQIFPTEFHKGLDMTVMTPEEILQVSRIVGKGKTITLLYRASRDGDNADDFHRKCDDHPNTLIVIKGKDYSPFQPGNVFGGFSPHPWNSYVGCYYGKKIVMSGSWLFTLNGYGGDGTPQKLELACSPHKYATYCSRKHGPSFGYHQALFITGIQCRKYGRCKSKLEKSGFGYVYNSGPLKSLYRWSTEFTPEDYEVYEVSVDKNEKKTEQPKLKKEEIPQIVLSEKERRLFGGGASVSKVMNAKQALQLVELCGIGKKHRPLKKLLFRCSRDGDTAKAFHKKCDNCTNTLTVIKTKEGYLFGGFTPHPWNSCKGYYDKAASGSWIFSLNSGDGKPRRFEQRKTCLSSNPKARMRSIFCDPKYGPTFGGGCDILIHDGCQTNMNSYSRLGNVDHGTYQCGIHECGVREEGSLYTLNGKGTIRDKKYFVVDDYEVYKI